MTAHMAMRVRMAMGARRSGIGRMIVGQGMKATVGNPVKRPPSWARRALRPVP